MFLIQTVHLVTAIRSTRLVLEAAVGYRNSLYKFMWVPNNAITMKILKKCRIIIFRLPIGFRHNGG